MVVAIDGPAGSGKSTVARMVATQLGFNYLDTGAMYRCFAVLAKRDGLQQLLPLKAKFQLGERVMIDGEDVTELIRTPDISQLASELAADPAVRSELVKQQQQIMAEGMWVAEGRDIGTVVAPTAEVKVFLTATAQERARRRAAQLGAPLAEVLDEQQQRDQRDLNRTHSPLKAAPDAVELLTDGMSIEQVVGEIIKLVEAKNR